MSSVTVYGRHSPDFFFSDAYSVFVCKVYYLLALFLRIAYRGISSTAFVLDTAYHKVCSVNHAPIADLDSGLWVCFGRFCTHRLHHNSQGTPFRCHGTPLSCMAGRV